MKTNLCVVVLGKAPSLHKIPRLFLQARPSWPYQLVHWQRIFPSLVSPNTQQCNVCWMLYLFPWREIEYIITRIKVGIIIYMLCPLSNFCRVRIGQLIWNEISGILADSESAARSGMNKLQIDWQIWTWNDANKQIVIDDTFPNVENYFLIWELSENYSVREC